MNLKEFLERLKNSEFGECKKEEIIEFLDEIKENIIQNLYIKIEEKPEWRSIVENREIEIHNEIEELKKEFY